MLEAATALFATKGFEGTSVKEVAEKAVVSVGLVCRYFPTREHLALAIYERLASELAGIAVDLPAGTIAQRFKVLMLARISQCEAQRGALTALMGKALDPSSSLYALGPATENTRAKIHGALGVTIACARNAPSTAAELSRQSQMLYMVQLGIVLATLSLPDSTWARTLVDQATRVLSWTQLPFVRQFIASRLDALMLDRLCPVMGKQAGKQDRHLSHQILVRLFADNRVLPGVPAGLTPAAEALHLPRIETFVRAGVPIELVLPAFPAKAPNPRKVLGTLPDLAEQRALERLSELLDHLTEVWAPGARLTICSDGHVFADAVGVADATVDAYRAALLRLIGDPRVSWFDLSTAFGDQDPAILRAELMEKYAESETSLRARAEQSRSLAAQIDGIHRFLFEDAVVLHPDLSKNQAKKHARARAYEVVRRSEAWGVLIADVFPTALRLSIHPQPDPSTKIGINLLGVRDPWMTPWHGVAVVGRDGTRLMHRHEAEGLGAVVVHEDGRPSHMEIP